MITVVISSRFALIACQPQAVIKDYYADRLCQRYKLDSIEGKQSWEILEMIGRKRGMLISGGEIDYERASVMLLDEFKKGKLGKFTFEMPEDY